MQNAINIEVEVPEGKSAGIVGRNGTFDIKKVNVWEGPTNGLCYVDGIGKKGTAINGGLGFPVEIMDEIAKQWLRGRGKHVS